MRYLKKYETFKNQKSEPVNEEFILKGIKNLFKKGQERLNKTKGGKEIEVIYQKYLAKINTDLAKTAKIDLNIAAASTGELPAAAGTKNAAAAKLAKETLDKAKIEMEKLVLANKTQALKEMDAILAGFKGAAKNPQLKILIDNKKGQFELDFITAKAGYLAAAGADISELTKQRDALSQKIEASFKDFDTAKAVTYEVGNEVIYLLKDKKAEEYDKTKKPEDQKDIVGVNKIAEIDGDNFTLEDEKGEPTIKKTGSELMGKVAGEEKEAIEYKAGDLVIYKRDKFDEAEWKKVTDEDKKKPDEGPMKDLKDKKMIGVKTIEEISGENVSFEGTEVEKKTTDLLGTIEGAKAEGLEDLVKKLGEIKSKKPEDITKVSKYVDFISDEKNKDKSLEIDKIMSEGEEDA